MDWTILDRCIEILTGITSLAAIFYTARESRRNNRAILKIIDSSMSGQQSIDENRQQFFQKFTVVLKNVGIPLRSVEASLSFVNSKGYGRLNIPLQKRGPRTSSDEFAKGMVVEFDWKSYELHTYQIEMLKDLKDLSKQDARLSVYSSGYLARQWKLGSRLEQIKTNWCLAASRTNFRFKRFVPSPDGKRQLLKTYKILPVPQLLGRPILDFIRSIDFVSAGQKRGAA